MLHQWFGSKDLSTSLIETFVSKCNLFHALTAVRKLPVLSSLSTPPPKNKWHTIGSRVVIWQMEWFLPLLEGLPRQQRFEKGVGIFIDLPLPSASSYVTKARKWSDEMNIKKIRTFSRVFLNSLELFFCLMTKKLWDVDWIPNFRYFSKADGCNGYPCSSQTFQFMTND